MNDCKEVFLLEFLAETVLFAFDIALACDDLHYRAARRVVVVLVVVINKRVTRVGHRSYRRGRQEKGEREENSVTLIFAGPITFFLTNYIT